MLRQMESNYDNCCWRKRPEKFWKFRVFLLVQVTSLSCEWLSHSSWRVFGEVFSPWKRLCCHRVGSFDEFHVGEGQETPHFSERAGSSVHVCTFYWQHSHDSGPINNVAPTWRTTYHNYFWNAVSAVSFDVSIACAVADHRQHRLALAVCRLFTSAAALLGMHSCVHRRVRRKKQKAHSRVMWIGNSFFPETN